jgi:hypothetical protein
MSKEAVMWLAIVCVLGWSVAVAAAAWGANRHLKLKKAQWQAEAREDVRRRVAMEADWRDAEPVLLRFPTGERQTRA